MVFADRLEPQNFSSEIRSLCNRLWPCKTTVQPQKFSSELKFSSPTAKLSTLNDLQYTICNWVNKNRPSRKIKFDHVFNFVVS